MAYATTLFCVCFSCKLHTPKAIFENFVENYCFPKKTAFKVLEAPFFILENFVEKQQAFFLLTL